MLVKRIASAPKALLDPDASEWSSAPEETVALAGTSAGAQPNRYLRNALKGRSIGAVGEVRVRAAHDGQSVYFRLEWRDPREDRVHVEGGYPDAAAVLFPLNGEAPLETMGSDGKPVNAWFWRPDIEEEPQNLTAKGLGTVTPAPGSGLESRSARSDGAWKVVLARPLAANGTSVKLAPGASTSIAVAVWDGGSDERGGVKAFSKAWRDLQVEA